MQTEPLKAKGAATWRTRVRKQTLAAIVPEWSSKSARLILLQVVQFVIVATALSSSLHLRHKNLSVPFVYSYDTLFYLTNVSTIIRNGWFWTSSFLSAPFTFPIIAFPSNSSVDFAVVWVVAHFSSNPGLVLNVSWLIFFFLTAATAFHCLRQFHVNSTVAMLFGVIFAFLPFAFYRATSHLALSFYLVPFACSLAVAIVSGSKLSPRFRAAMLIGCGLLGFNYIYNAFFAAGMIAVAVLIAVLRGRTSNWRIGVLAIAIIGATTAANLAPSLYYWHAHGRPFQDYKAPAEAEFYGLRIRQLITPQPWSRLPLLRQWTTKDALAFRTEDESRMANLGLVPAIGFLLLIAAVFKRRWLDGERNEELRAASDLNLVLVLVGTIGGFGAVFALLVSPAIRCYNRVSIFIGFLSIFALALLMSRALDRLRYRHAGKIVLALLFLLAIYDQAQTAANVRWSYHLDAAVASTTADTVRQLESRICSQCMVFQLPDTPFPQDPGRNRMLPYDQARPHTYSASLHWSWPAFTPERRAWGGSLKPSDPGQLVRQLGLAGFQAIWLDRWGYAGPDSPEPGLTRLLGSPTVVSADGRIAVFDIRQFAALPFSAAEREGALRLPFMELGKGFYAEEYSADGSPFYWSEAKSGLTIRNNAVTSRRLIFRGAFHGSTAEGQPLVIRIGERTITEQISSSPKNISVPMELGANESAEVSFEYYGKRLDAPADARQLYFAVTKPEVTY